jgi:hypothetical protein
MRKPSQLRAYLQDKVKMQREYGGFQPFIIKEKLKWVANDSGVIEPANPVFLGDNSDVKMLLNDYPYGVDPGIVHIVVWSKAVIPEDGTGKPADEATRKIKAYIKNTFQDQLGMRPDDILWFKNSFDLRSIRSIEHFHVLLNQPPMSKLQLLIGTSGVIPM